MSIENRILELLSLRFEKEAPELLHELALSQVTDEALHKMTEIFLTYLDEQYGPLSEEGKLPLERIRDFQQMNYNAAAMVLVQMLSMFKMEHRAEELARFLKKVGDILNLYDEIGQESIQDLSQFFDGAL